MTGIKDLDSSSTLGVGGDCYSASYCVTWFWVGEGVFFQIRKCMYEGKLLTVVDSSISDL